MKKILLFLFMLLPITSFAEAASDGMTTIFEEHFDGLLYLHGSGMNSTYKVSPYVSLQSYKIKSINDVFPCIITPGRFSTVVYNNTEALGDFILSFKDYNNNISVSASLNNANGKKMRSRTYSKGETLLKATAVVMKGYPGKYKIDSSTEESIIDNDNQLKAAAQKQTQSRMMAITSMLANKDGEVVGFYWDAPNSAAFSNGEHKAYLAIPTTDIEGTATKPYYVFPEYATTAIGKIKEDGNKPLYYTINGRKCQQEFKGLVIVNGRKTIKR